MNKSVRKTFKYLHLWLGLLTGVVVFIVCITGCLYVFKDEITDLREPYRFVAAQDKAFLPTSQLLEIANKTSKKSDPSSISLNGKEEATIVTYGSKHGNITSVYINPYDGTVLNTYIKKKGDFEFFYFVIRGHKFLWLPREIGKPVVSYSVLIFAITLITGIILWWPRKWNRQTIKRGFILKLKGSFSKINFNLHKVAGFYAAIFLLIMAITGLIKNLDWFSEFVYYATSGGEKLVPYKSPKSDTITITLNALHPIDILSNKLLKEEPDAKSFYFSLPKKKEDTYRVSVVHERNSYYKQDNLFFDQYSLEPLEGTGTYAGKYTEASAADNLRRMNLDIHTGKILGLPGKIIAFLASLIGASLPISGVIIWIKRIRKKAV